MNDPFAHYSQLYDAVLLLSKRGMTISKIAAQLGMTKQRVVACVQEALIHGVVQISMEQTSAQGMALQRMFPAVSFRIITAKAEFSRLAAFQVLTWVRDVIAALPRFDKLHWKDTNNRDVNPPGEPAELCPYVAVGGGKAIHSLVSQFDEVLKSSEGRHLGEWYLGARRFCVVNATAGGRSRRPQLEASQVAGQFAARLNQECGLFTVSSDPDEEEKNLTRSAIMSTVVTISGVGDPEQAYCVQAMRSKATGSEQAYEKMVGEFLFHLFDERCEAISESGSAKVVPMETKETTLRSNWQTSGHTMLARLFEWKSLCGQPTVENVYARTLEGTTLPRYVIAVASGDEDTRVAKARAIHTLLQNGYLTHACISAGLAEEILNDARQRGTITSER